MKDSSDFEKINITNRGINDFMIKKAEKSYNRKITKLYAARATKYDTKSKI